MRFDALAQTLTMTTSLAPYACETVAYDMLGNAVGLNHALYAAERACARSRARAELRFP